MGKLDKIELILDLTKEQMQRLKDCIMKGEDPSPLEKRDKQIKMLMEEVCQH